jgi:phosphatidylserine/phosphatidylglycerophosphate/cardiolipin synthase-like enzyme
VREVEQLYLDAIAAARCSLYFENQFFTSSVVGQALCDRLLERDGPEVVIVLSRGGTSWLEEATMNVLRARLLRKLLAADRYGRLRVCYPDVEGLENARLTVHSKVLVVDDRLLRVGSANLNNRSMGLDSECDVALDAAGDLAVRERIAGLRNRLLAEHLGQTPDCVAATIASTGSLLRTVDTLNGGRRALRPLDGEDVASWLDCIVPAIVDPDRPVWADTLIDRMLPSQVRRSRAARRWLWPATLVAVAAVLFVALRRVDARRAALR